MNLERLIKDIGKMAAKILLNKEETSNKEINFSQISSEDILKIILKRLVNDGEYNKAENMLFDEISKNNSQNIHEIALGFYDMLLEKSDEELQKCGFTREEIYQGLEDIKNIDWKEK